MKKLAFLLSILVLSSGFISCDEDDDKKIDVTDLPQNAQNFLQTHFSGIEVLYTEKDNDSYDARLANGYEVDFDLSGEWDNVDGNRQQLPESILNLLPTKIIECVAEGYPGNVIVEVDKYNARGVYEIELDNGLDLVFEMDGAFRCVDR